MINRTTVRASLCVAALLLSLGAGITVKAETNTSDVGIAGISPVLEHYYATTAALGTGTAEDFIDLLSLQKEMTKVVSPYANLGISTSTEDSYVNIRSKANAESKVVGKLYRGCATDIIETKGEWVKIHSGNVDGYIKAEFLAIGNDAEELADEFSTKYATVKTETLYVRDKKSTDSEITTMIPIGETYCVVKEYDEWVKILIDAGDVEEGGETGFVSKEFVDIDVEFDYAISIKEEKAKLAAEEVAKQAEIERLETLANEQEEERNEETQNKAAAETTAKETEVESNQRSTSTSSSVSESSSSSSGQEIANYAMNFVGNSYVWGGTSLTNGADCSGFVQSIYSHFGYGITRTSRDQSSNAGVEVSLSNLQAGDLIFYCNSGGVVSHVAMYLGNGTVVHASNAREGIKTSSYNYRTPYKARRILN